MGFRAVAAYLVFVHHAFPQLTFISGFFRLFFVLSGFLIALRYTDTFGPGQKFSWSNYFLQRLTRLYPLYFLCTIIALLFQGDNRLASWIINIFMLQGLFSEFTFSGIGVSWTLTVELCFYAAAPFVLKYWDRIGWFTILLLTVFTGLVLLGVGQFPWPYAFVPNWSFLLNLTFFGRCLEFYIGIWLAKKYLSGLTHQGFFASKKGVLTFVGGTGILGCLLLIRFLLIIETSIWNTIGFYALNYVCIPLFVGSLILGLAKEQTFIATLLGSKTGQALGKGSYFFYLVHYTFGFDVLYFHVWQNRLGVMFLLALLSIPGYYLLEVPMRKAVLAFFRKSAETIMPKKGFG